jgi:uncharacterized protein YbjT (DUF2867 family)
MRVAIAGGHGKIGRRLTRLLREHGDEPRPLIRNPGQAAELEGEPVVVDLEEADETQVARALKGMDAVVFAAGAGPGSGTDRKLTMDLGGAVKLIAAAKANGINRYVMVSSQGADATAEGDDTFAVYLRAKGEADDQLRDSGLDFSIVRPTGLTDEPGTGTVEIAERVERGQISRDDVASVLMTVLHEPAAIGRTFALGPGDVPIEQAVARLR